MVIIGVCFTEFIQYVSMSEMRAEAACLLFCFVSSGGIRLLSGLEDDIPFAPQKVDHTPVTRPDVYVSYLQRSFQVRR
jgi:hypothetical protein